VSRKLAEENRRPAFRAVQQAIGGSDGVHLWDPLPALCARDDCPAEWEGIVMYSDDEHLTYAGSRWLGPALQVSLAWQSVLKDMISPRHSPQVLKRVGADPKVVPPGGSVR
jgi:hypothetical protein